MRKLTDPQKKLLELLKLYKYVKNSDGVFQYDHMKNICDFKSFDGTFNALVNIGIVQYVYGTGLNTFELSDKCEAYTPHIKDLNSNTCALCSNHSITNV